jgi:5'-3' exonuclease
MGIKGFTTWFLKNFPFVASIIQRNANKTRFFDHIYIDLNQLIHLCARKAKNEEHLFLKVFKELDRLFRLCCPRKSVYLVLDGPASKAKLLEQRKRRKKAASKPSKGKQGHSFDALQITPGTYFMHRLKNSLCYYVCNRLQKSRRFERVKFYVSGSDVAGEGEIKIVNYIKNKPAYHRSEDSYLIVGTDADLILLGLCVDERNVFVMAERVHEYFLLSVSRLRRYFENSLSTKPRDENTINTTGSSHLDFVLLSFMMGNDYLPKFKGASLPKLWPRYIVLKRAEFADTFLYNPSTEAFNIPFLQALMTRPRREKKGKEDEQGPTEQKTDNAAPTESTNNNNNNNVNAINADESDAADDNANDDEADDEKQGDVPEMTAKDEAEVRQWIETHGVQMTDDILETELDSDNDDIVESSSSDEVFDEEFDDEVVIYGSNWQFQKSEPRPRKEPLTREERDDQALVMVQKYLEGLLWCLYTYTK